LSRKKFLRYSCFVLLFLAVFPLEDTLPGRIQAQFDHAWKLFVRGDLARSQEESALGVEQFRAADYSWSLKFQLLEAESMLFRGMYPHALQLLASYPAVTPNPNETVLKLAIEAAALTREERLVQASEKLAQAGSYCQSTMETPSAYPACGDFLRASGILATKRGQSVAARLLFIKTLSFAQMRQDRFLEASASLNLGWAALQSGRFDEALDWSKLAQRDAVQLGAEDLSQLASGNLGWAYYELGDRERALGLFIEARKTAELLGDFRQELMWASTSGYVYRDTGDLPRATESYRQALALAMQIGSKEDIVNALEDLAQVSADAGQLDASQRYIDQVAPMELAGGNHLSANVLLTEGMLAAARRQDKQAESLFKAVQQDTDNPTTTRLGAGQQMARLYEVEGNAGAAEQMYKATLSAFDSAQAELKSEESQLPFVANAARIYDDYIHLLLAQGRSNEALAVADQSRARTLAQQLGAGGRAAAPAALDPRPIAQKAGATLLFYWLGPKQSCLWAVTPAKVAFYLLPAQDELAARVARYRKALLNDDDPLGTANADGLELYRALVAPAAQLIDAKRPIMILADGALNQLNFETLLVPAADPQARGGSQQTAPMHYWIDDVTLLSAPSLAMLAAARPVPNSSRNLLLLGNPVSASDEFPNLPLFAYEMRDIPNYFDPHNVAAFASSQATPAAYLSSHPGRYAYIHFVSHAVSSRTDPLDSAIILSPDAAGADSFKLYARDIMRIPIDARLVTISACYGSGTRSYAGEGLVGLSWAFLRAGAHAVIGALWEVSDDSTPRLMDALYQGMAQGQTPAAALRQAKLTLLHSNSRFQAPVYWAPFQIYSSR
jgi:CHAT domain-containing protein/tetratricopeptide (TPR) repeat protein